MPQAKSLQHDRDSPEFLLAITQPGAIEKFPNAQPVLFCGHTLQAGEAAAAGWGVQKRRVDFSKPCRI